MEDSYMVTGLMSGSSLDGVDLACCEFSPRGKKWSYRVLEAETIPYPESLLYKLKHAISWDKDHLEELDTEAGSFYASLLNQFHQRHQLTPGLISSHGHTILHDPGKGITFQVGHGGVMADKTGIAVVNNFRSEDVAQGGQGAPLVPLGDRILFGEFGACLNLGGFANISFEGSHLGRVAFDICPANMALNRIAGMEGLAYDRDGTIARSGSVFDPLLQELNQLEFYHLPSPKSLGTEWFLHHFVPRMEKYTIPVPDLMATVVEHISIQMGRAIDQSGANQVLVTGGGVLNQFLIQRIQQHIHSELVIPEPLLIEFKEALIFAFLGLLRIRGETNCLASVTGGRRDLSTGTVYAPK